MTAAILLTIGIVLGVFVVVQLLWVKLNGRRVPLPKVSRLPRKIGAGAPLRYAVLGDSTSVAQGGDYSQGYAVATAEYLASRYEVEWLNLGESGARAGSVLHRQLPAALAFSPDIILIAVGANDVTHFTKMTIFTAQLEQILHSLRQANPDVRVILTGAPAMGTIPRFPLPLRSIMGRRTLQINGIVKELAKKHKAVFAPIAEQTEELYRAHPELFAADKFHPTSEGYLPWIPILQRAIDKAEG
ncbi:MAG TPA: SGNH/GDSL hydrolase family protein [Verrucomicrobiae bacterium]|nr:SGNH/GDSL hydrolase family protein [Verrucomicrobiae bacterium]